MEDFYIAFSGNYLLVKCIYS